MNRLNKLLLSFVLPIFCLLINVSHAVPDVYCFNNFLTGISPYYSLGSLDYTDTYFYPNISDDSNNQGIVVSFSNQFMNGTTIPSALPLLDMEYCIGKVFELPAGKSMAVTCKSSVVPQLYCSDNFYMSFLGTTKPDTSTRPLTLSNASVGNGSYSQVVYDNNGPIVSSRSDFLSLNYDAMYLPTAYTFYVNFADVGRVSVFMITNTSDEPLYFSNQRDLVLVDEPVVTYDADSIFSNAISWCFYYVTDESSASTGKVFGIPHINGNVDVYTRQFTDLYSTSAYFGLEVRDNIICSVSVTEAGNLVVGIDNKLSMLTKSGGIYTSLLTPTSDYVPFFIESLYSTQKEAIFIKNGYINVNNYEELVALLKENGIGQADLTRVIQLLDEINTGGATGEEVKELVGILESYHQQLQNQANFGSATGIFDTYKNILEFSSDMHWLITANNALFEYFAGFIMMCALFLFLSRVMR